MMPAPPKIPAKIPRNPTELRAKRLKFSQDKFPLDLVQFHLLLSWHLVRFVSQLLKTLVRWDGSEFRVLLEWVGLDFHFTQYLIAPKIVENCRTFCCRPGKPEELFAFRCRLYVFKLPLNKCRERCP